MVERRLIPWCIMRRLACIYFTFFMLIWMTTAAAAPPLAPVDYYLHPALELSLFAKEPDVVDPVALTWDEEGNMYVVEMRDYPYGFGPERKPGGTIRLLQDTDGDGKIDRVTLFATNLSFPTSIAAWNGGVLVTAPPDIVFLKDSDGDGTADVREVLLKGFVLGVTDSNLNGLRWGLDNRLHGVNGGNGGEVISPRKPGPPISIRNLDFSFDPSSGDFTTTYHTSGGFGLTFDEWGRSFVTYNINHIQQRLIPARYLNRFPGFPPIQATESISDHDEMSRIYPISEPETRVNHPEQSGHFSSAGGMAFIGSPAYPPDLYRSIFVCDVVGNLVHRDVLSARGPAFVASRSPQETNIEFFASRDRAFRPIGVETGPDGALYLIDMQRDVIEHPDYIPEKIRSKLNLRAGEDRGRIYRMTPKGGLPPLKPNLRRASSTELVDHLSHSNSWWRYTAQRLLIERGAESGWTNSAIANLKRLAASGQASLGRLHALWTLEGLKALDERLILTALSDAEAGVRENAVLLAEAHPPGFTQLQRRLLSMADDRNARVRFQAALTVGQLNAISDVQSALTEVLLRDYSFRWSRLAVLSSLSQDEEKFLRFCLTNSLFRHREAKLDLFRELADLIGARASNASTQKLWTVFAMLVELPADEQSRISVLEGLQTGLERSGAKLAFDGAIASYFEKLSASPALLTATWKVSRTLGFPQTGAQQLALSESAQRALDPSRSQSARLDDVRLLALGEYSSVSQPLFALLDGLQPAKLQLAAIDALRQFDNVDVAKRLLQRWHSLAPAARTPVLNLLLQRLSFHDALLDALESGQLTVGELNLDLEQRRRLLWESTPELRERAARFIGDGEYANRKSVIEDWLQKLPATGDTARGRAVFEKTCAQCHALDGIGVAVGPDLGALAHRSVEDLLSNILDPNMAINPSYIAYTVETSAGEIESGILQSESAEAVQLLQALGRKVTIPRKQIRQLHSSGLSLMPEGLEAGLTPSDLRDLIEFLQRTR
jgi:putative membrane-bound dehydrogenase-like protein